MNSLKAMRLASIAVLMALSAMLVAGIHAGSPRVNAQTPPWEQAVTGLIVGPGESAGSLAISWDAHPGDPQDYRVKWAPQGENYRRYGNLDWNAYPTSTSHTVTGLVPGDTYKVRVLARVNTPDRQRSPWSAEVSAESAPGWTTVALDAANSASRGVWSDGTTVWVVDSAADKVFAYVLASGARDAAGDIDTLDADNTHSQGIWSDGTTMWIADDEDDKVYAYDLASGARDAAADIDTLDADNSHPMGIWSDGTSMWIADDEDDKVYAYDLASGARDETRDIDSLDAAGNNHPRGIWSDGTTLWIADDEDDKVYAYELASGARYEARDIDTLSGTSTDDPWGLWSDGASMLVASIAQGHLARHDVPASAWSRVLLDAANSASRGVWSDGTTVWVADSAADKVFAYNLASGARVTSRDIDTLDADNTHSRGIWSDGITMWIADGRQDKVFAYDLASGARDEAGDIDTLDNAGNNRSMGIWSDGTIMWVADDEDDKVYAYDLVSGDRDEARDIDTLGAAGNEHSRGIWSDGITMWVADSRGDKVYAYDLASGAREEARDIDTLGNTATNNPWGLWSDGATMLVASIAQGHLARHDVPPPPWTTVSLDADNSASRGVWSDGTTLWVADSVADKVFAYDLASGARDETRDIDSLHADNTHARGIWSDGTTMWIADMSRDKVFAYDLASGARDAANDINNLARVGNSRPMGIWSDGNTMWVADDGNDMLYVYSLVHGVRPVGRSIVSLNGAGNNHPRGIWSDGTTMWVSDSRDDKVYAYDLASGARVAAQDIDTLSATATDNPWGLWSDGASMLVASIEEGHLARHDLPAAPEPTGWTIGSGCTVGANSPEPTEVAVDAIPIVVSSTTDDYFVLYASFDVDGQTWEMPVAVVLGEAGTTTLAENAEALAQDRYRIEKYLVADPADVDGDCVDDITELENLSITSPVNAASAIDRRDGSVSVPNLNAFLRKAYTRPYQFTGTESASGVKILVTDLDTDIPGLYFLDYHSYSYHVLVLHELGLESVDVEGLITYDPSRAAPDGSVGAYYLNLGMGVHKSFSEVELLYTLIAANMAHLDDDLYVHFGNDVLPQLQPEASLYEASRIDILLDDDVFPEASFVSMNPGVGFGQLRIQSPDERPHPRDIVIYETLPNELPRVAGIITTVQQTPLSHVNLRAIQNEIPNAYVQDATNHADITDLIDGYVRYEVTDSGWSIRAATPAEVDAHYAASRPTETQTPVRDLTVETITALSDVDFDDSDAFGVKAANVAELGTLGFADGTVPDGFAIPFYFYDEFMKANELYDDIDDMLADEDFQDDFDVQDEMLDDLRDDIKDAETPQWIIDALTDMHAEIPDGQSLRYRSSTNNEDLPGFNGAGLYDSKTQKPDETEEDGIDKSLKQVYASMWNFRAFTEREFYRVDHTKAAMGVLVHPNYTDELANGVAVSFDPFYELDYYYVNTQVGEDLVTNPEAHSKPEELLVSTDNDYFVLASSNLVPSGQLLMSDDQLQQLAEHLETIHDHFEELYDPADDEPFAIEIEFKITSDNILAIKQARPWIFNSSP